MELVRRPVAHKARSRGDPYLRPRTLARPSPREGVYVNHAAKGRESTGETDRPPARGEEKYRNTQTRTRKKTSMPVPADRPRPRATWRSPRRRPFTSWKTNSLFHSCSEAMRLREHLPHMQWESHQGVVYESPKTDKSLCSTRWTDDLARHSSPAISWF